MFSAGISSSPSTGQNHFSRHLSFAARIHPKTDEIFKVENYRRSDKIDQSIRRKLRNKPYYEIPRYKENHDGNEPSTSFLVTGRTKEDMDRIFQQEEEMLNETVHRSVKRLEELDHSRACH